MNEQPLPINKHKPREKRPKERFKCFSDYLDSELGRFPDVLITISEDELAARRERAAIQVEALTGGAV